MSDRNEFVSRPVLEERAKSLKKLVWIVSGLVLLLVVMMRSPYKIPLPEGVELSLLPPLHALLNTLVAACLLGGLLSLAPKNRPLSDPPIKKRSAKKADLLPQ
ncbi:hypothetical protein N9Z77_02140 [Akkermansiaceae bacterium]|nr:hypothetical protein [Akkermansiaceae bacterium]